jgi:hypothetical protein
MTATEPMLAVTDLVKEFPVQQRASEARVRR